MINARKQKDKMEILGVLLPILKPKEETISVYHCFHMKMIIFNKSLLCFPCTIINGVLQQFLPEERGIYYLLLFKTFFALFILNTVVAQV
jgi:hypothetical protein